MRKTRNVYDNVHWNIYDILPYQRNFNFIIGKRSVGKTYTTLFYLMEQAIVNDKQFIYVVRTEKEKDTGLLEKGLAKVIAQQYEGVEFSFTNEKAYVIEDGVKRLIAHCYALSGTVKMKKESFPNVYYMFFDEYTLEKKFENLYVKGWNEPDLLLNMYHTVDREEDRVKVFMMGNNTQFYNPYHLHHAFNIPIINIGEIHTSENVLYQWCNSSEQLEEYKSKSKFLKMIEDTEYGQYASKGEFVGDNYEFICKLPKKVKYIATIIYKGNKFGVHKNYDNGDLFISRKIDETCQYNYCLSEEDHKEGVLLAKYKKDKVWLYGYIAECYKMGKLKFDSMKIKTKFGEVLTTFL